MLHSYSAGIDKGIVLLSNFKDRKKSVKTVACKTKLCRSQRNAICGRRPQTDCSKYKKSLQINNFALLRLI